MGYDGTVVRGLRGKSIVFTGKLFLRGEWVTRADAIRRAAQAGAQVSSNKRARISRFTDLLVLGEGEGREDEEDVARLQKQGHDVRIIDAEGFASLLDGDCAYAITPLTNAEQLPDLTAPYRPAREDATPEPVPTTTDLLAATTRTTASRTLSPNGFSGAGCSLLARIAPTPSSILAGATATAIL